MNKYEFYSGMQDGYPELKEIYEDEFCGSGVIGGAMRRKKKAHSRKRRVGSGRSKRSGSKRSGSKRRVAKRSASKRRVGGSKRRVIRRATSKRRVGGSKRSGSKRSGSKRRIIRRATSKRSGSKRRVIRRATGGSKTRRIVHRRPIGGSKRSSSGVKRTRAPSAYNMFVKKFLNSWKRQDPSAYNSMSQQDRMRVAAGEWRNQ